MTQFELPAGVPDDERRFGAKSLVWPCLAIALVLALQAQLVLTRAINWDEFWFYSTVESFARTAITTPLQTFHVHLFGWLVGMPGNGVDHIVWGRIAMFAAELATLASIAAIGTHFSGRRAGLLCVLAYLGGVYTMQHGFAFRVDPLAASLSMGALVVLLKTRLDAKGILAFGLLLGLAGMVTIKVALFAPAVAGIAWMRLTEAERPGAMFARLAGCGIAALGMFAAFYGLHQLSMDQPDAASSGAVGSGSQIVKTAVDYSISFGVDSYVRYFRDFAERSPLQILLVIAAPFAILRSGLPQPRRIALLGMLATSVAFLIYKNTLPYFYPFILAPIICGTAPLLRSLSQRFPVALVAAPLALFSVLHWAMEPPSPIDRQRALINAATTIFPERVSYFDFCGMLGVFDKVNYFMTTWGMQGYKAAGVPVMRQTMLRQPVPLVLVSEQEGYPTFRRMLTTTGSSPYFVDEDAAALRDNYLPFWGPYWLAGKAIPADGAAHREEFLVPGPYTVRDAAVSVDGTGYSPGDVIRLERGFHELQAAGSAPARLFWGERLKEPAYAPPDRPYWTDF